MTVTHRATPGEIRRQPQKRRPARVALPLMLIGALAVTAVAGVAFLLWPRWPAATASIDAPSLPLTVGGVAFNIPPAAIRVDMQRKPGAHDRVDLMFLWPSLDPPDPAHLVSPVTSDAQAERPQVPDRLFITIAVNEGTMPPEQRLKTIYPRYLTPSTSPGPADLAVQAFRDGTPYQGEDLIFDPAHPEAFAPRCSRTAASAMPGMCLYERRIDAADVIVRFPREWLQGGSEVAKRIEELITRMHGKGA